MRRIHLVVLIAGLVALAPVLAGCEDFDMDKLDFFHLNEKKKLPGERKELFPGGVPGVSQGVPAEYMKGYQEQQSEGTTPLPDAAAGAPVDKTAAPAPAAKTAAVEPAAEPKLKPKPKPKRKPKPTTAQTGNVAVRPTGQAQDNNQQQMAPWPSTPRQQPASGQGNEPWAAAPAPGSASH